jgi:hypothetical protein
MLTLRISCHCLIFSFICFLRGAVFFGLICSSKALSNSALEHKNQNHLCVTTDKFSKHEHEILPPCLNERDLILNNIPYTIVKFSSSSLAK